MTYLRRPHLSGRYSTDITLDTKAHVPQAAAKARIVLASMPKDLYVEAACGQQGLRRCIHLKLTLVILSNTKIVNLFIQVHQIDVLLT